MFVDVSSLCRLTFYIDYFIIPFLDFFVSGSSCLCFVRKAVDFSFTPGSILIGQQG